MTSAENRPTLSGCLSELVGELEGLGPRIGREGLMRALASRPVRREDVAAFVAPQAEGYARRRVTRTENFELLVMTWLPGQGSEPHDHAGSESAFQIICGHAAEIHYTLAPDSLVDPAGRHTLSPGDVGLDCGDVIHSVQNPFASGELLVTLHVYAPPVPELRRYTQRFGTLAPPPVVRRQPQTRTPVVAIVGCGYSGAMVAVHLLRQATQSGMPMHLVMLDRQASVAEGAAYRTPDRRHLLNVPASGMSAWPDRPDDFLVWAQRAEPDLRPYSFLPRRRYGEYLRATFLEALAQSGPTISVEIRRAQAEHIDRGGGRGWTIRERDADPLEADCVVLATGHRPPADPLRRCWSGSRARYIEDPWAALALAAIRPDESVCLLGSGLTAMDVLLSLDGGERQARVVAISRRGLLPASHASSRLAAIDPREWLMPLLNADPPLSIVSLARKIRRAVRAAEFEGQDWRQVIDGLRPHIAAIWGRLAARDRGSFLRHGRAFWEVVRHRMAPQVAWEVHEATRNGVFNVAAGRVMEAVGDIDGASLIVRRRGLSTPEAVRVDWVVNCTGPGSGGDYGLPPSVEKLIEAGLLEADEHRLGVRSSASGEALVEGRAIDELVLIGSLRKADLWESTAIPELRHQAVCAADAIIRRLRRLLLSRDA